jgi:hypothetical protein
MRFLSIILVGATLGANAFGVAPRTRATTPLTSLQLSPPANANEPGFVQNAVKTIGVLSLGSVLAFNVADASATALVPDDTAFSKSQACVRAVKAITPFSTLSFQLSASSLSSTQLVADAIKTMDMTMPSYDTISTSKNTQETLSSLVIEQPTAVATPKKAASKQKGEPMKGPSLGAVLPSLNKEGPKKKATAAAKKAQQGTPAGCKTNGRSYRRNLIIHNTFLLFSPRSYKGRETSGV